jgi:hypothetical protein
VPKIFKGKSAKQETIVPGTSKAAFSRRGKKGQFIAASAAFFHFASFQRRPKCHLYYLAFGRPIPLIDS